MVKRYESKLSKRLGKNIATFRRRAGLTQEQLSEQIDVDIATVSRYETGMALPSLVTLERVAQKLHCTMSELLDEKQPPLSTATIQLEATLNTLPPNERELALSLFCATVSILQKQPRNKPKVKKQ